MEFLTAPQFWFRWIGIALSFGLPATFGILLTLLAWWLARGTGRASSDSENA